MEEKLKKYWNEIKEAVLSRWGDQVQEEDLEKPMSYEQLCQYFGEKCDLRREQAEDRIERVVQEIEFRPPGV
jgi:ABC-type Na+ transport system ATPase subunit NatA